MTIEILSEFGQNIPFGIIMRYAYTRGKSLHMYKSQKKSNNNFRAFFRVEALIIILKALDNFVDKKEA